MTSQREPIFNVPAVVTATLLVLGLVHATREWVLSSFANDRFLRLFAFSPDRYEQSLIPGPWLGGVAADVWSFVTYALIHGDWMHLLFNGVWLLAFGTPVARRFGATRFLLLFVAAAAAGAVAHLIAHPGERAIMVGASASISAFMAAAIRFVFGRHGEIGLFGRSDDQAYRVPALPLTVALRDPRIIAFLAVWFGVNLIFGLGSLSIDGGEQAIAWQAHIGGFLAGLLGFSLFDPVGAPKRASDPDVRPTIH